MFDQHEAVALLRRGEDGRYWHRVLTFSAQHNLEPAGFLSDRMGRRNILLVAFGIFFITYLGFAFTQRVSLIAVLFVAYGLYQGIFRSVGKALASDYVPEHLRASGVGWYDTCIGLFGWVASLVAGWLWDKVT